MSMTREEAIKYGENKLTLLRALGYNNYYTPGEYAGYYDEFSFVTAALSALRPVSREQVEKVWKGEWEEERFAGEHEGWQHRECGRHSTEKTKWCPKCGKAMTDEAVDMVMERISEMEEMTNEH